ncbi:MAG TPA: PLP-dependent aminotransferase family protein [Candidatus Limnocylindrales bacterium]|nr:PLP-dependent aminotransferase family protein [Candidatus Limnocylindrales bacterium]
MPRSRTSSAGELLVELRRDEATPLHRQLEHELRAAIRTGRLAAEASLPSSRVLADQLGLSRGVVVEAYEQLVAEGYLTSRPGGTTRVAANVDSNRPRPASSAGGVEKPRIDFTYGRPDVTQFPRQAWMKSLRRVMNEAPSDRLSYLDIRGAEELRDALASYLNRVRGTCAEPDEIVICNGFAQALRLVVQVLKNDGGRRVAGEDPGFQDLRLAAEDHGLEVVPVPVDEAGLDVAALARTKVDAVVVTPAHHFPTGAVMSAERRAALVAWAKDSGALILEDDYDAEYRYDREPIGALHGLAPEQVIYAGSASKTLAPGLRLGWMLVPPRLVEPIAMTKEHIDRGSPSLEQLAFADFLSRGEFDHHLRRMRPIYRARRDVLLDAIRRHLPELRPVGASAGLHVFAWLPPGVDEGAIVRRAASAGVGVYGLSRYGYARSSGGGGLIFGYGAITEAEIVEGVQLVGEALASAAADPRPDQGRQAASAASAWPVVAGAGR